MLAEKKKNRDPLCLLPHYPWLLLKEQIVFLVMYFKQHPAMCYSKS